MTADPIRRIFDRIAPVYDPMNFWLSFGQHRIWKQMTVKWSGASLGHICLDICCGSGDLTQLLARRVGAIGHVTGVDFSANLLAVARQRAEQSFHPLPITWVEADALDLPIANHTIDAITMGYGLRNLADIPRGLAEIHRVLKPGSKAAILDFHRPTNASYRAFQQWYLDQVVVPLARQFGVTDEYAYIAPSLDRFPTGPEQAKLAQEVGFSRVTHYPIVGGTMGVLVVTK